MAADKMAPLYYHVMIGFTQHFIRVSLDISVLLSRILLFFLKETVALFLPAKVQSSSSSSDSHTFPSTFITLLYVLFIFFFFQNLTLFKSY